MSIALQDLHLLTRDGHLNADARRKLEKNRHRAQLRRPALDGALARAADRGTKAERASIGALTDLTRAGPLHPGGSGELVRGVYQRIRTG